MLECFPLPTEKWKKKTPKQVFTSAWHYIYKPNSQLTVIQLHLWAVIIGVIGGVFVYCYQKFLYLLVDFIWGSLPNHLHDSNVFKHFPAYNYIWIVQLICSTIIGVAIVICSKISFLRTPGHVGDMISKLHSRGFVGAHHFLPMFFLSVLSLASGASVGPETPMVILGAAYGGKIGRWLKQDLQHLRVLTLCGQSAALSTFFGLPLGGALFVLELPHRWGLQYYEAISPAILSSIVGVMVKKAIARETLGGEFIYPKIEELQVYHMLQGIVLGVMGAIIASFWAILTVYLKNQAKYIQKKFPARGVIGVAIVGGLLGAVIGMFYPLTLFWGENEMNPILSRGQHLPTHFPGWMEPVFPPYSNTSTPYPHSASDYFQIGIAKVFSTAIHVASGYPAGVIYPLFYIGAVWGYAISLATGWYATLCILSIMGSVEAAVTRCPWATIVVLIQTQGGFYMNGHEAVSSGIQKTYYLSVLPVMTVAVVTALILTRYMVYYPEQRNRFSHPFSLTGVAVRHPPAHRPIINGESREADSLFRNVNPLAELDNGDFPYTATSGDESEHKERPRW